MITFDQIGAKVREIFGGPTAAGETKNGFDLDAFLAEARETFRADMDADAEDREAAEDDNRFANAGDKNKEQWDKQMMQQRIAAGRPVLQRNLIPTYVQQVVNEGRQNDPVIKISPGDGGEPEDAQYLQDRIRHIEYESDASTVWDTAREQQVTSGRAAVRMVTEHVPGTFKQRPRLLRIPNQFSVVWDRAANAYDRSDAEHVFVISKISRAEHTRRFGTQTTLDSLPFTEAIQMAPDWMGVGSTEGGKGDLIQIAEWFRKEYKERTLVKLHNGREMWADELGKRMTIPQEVADSRTESVLDRVVCWIINGVEILPPDGPKSVDVPEKMCQKWLTKELPIVPVWGREAVVNGKKCTYSLIRNAKDSQRLVNFYSSNIAEQVGMMPKTPWLIEFGSIPQNHEDFWNQANNSPRGFLYWVGYDPKTGRAYNKPTREVSEPPIEALSIGLNQAIDGIKAAMGIFDASMGERSNENSGIAIQRRQIQSGIVNYHFPSNENRSRKRVGEILVSLIRILDKDGGEYPVRDYDGTTRLVPVGMPHKDHRTGKDIVIDPRQGEQNVVVETGLKFNSAKAEENARLTEWIKADPQLLTVIGDLAMRTSDFPGAEESADRMKAWIQKVNPGIIPEEDEQTPLPPQVQQGIMQLQQKLAETEAFAQDLHQQIQSKQVEADRDKAKQDAELQFKREELSATVRLELAKLGSAADKLVLEKELAIVDQQAGIQAQSVESEAARQHEKEMAAQGMEHDAAQSEASRQHEADQAAEAREAAAETVEQ